MSLTPIETVVVVVLGGCLLVIWSAISINFLTSFYQSLYPKQTQPTENKRKIVAFTEYDFIIDCSKVVCASVYTESLDRKYFLNIHYETDSNQICELKIDITKNLEKKQSSGYSKEYWIDELLKRFELYS